MFQIKIAFGSIRTRVLWCWKELFCQMCHTADKKQSCSQIGDFFLVITDQTAFKLFRHKQTN